MKKLSKTEQLYLGRKGNKEGHKKNRRRKVSLAKVRALREANRKVS